MGQEKRREGREGREGGGEGRSGAFACIVVLFYYFMLVALSHPVFFYSQEII